MAAEAVISLPVCPGYPMRSYTRSSRDLVHWSAATVQYTIPVSWPSGYFPYFGPAAKCLEKNNGQTIYISWSLPNLNLAKPEELPMIRAQFPRVTPVFFGIAGEASRLTMAPRVFTLTGGRERRRRVSGQRRDHHRHDQRQTPRRRPSMIPRATSRSITFVQLAGQRHGLRQSRMLTQATAR